MEPGIIIAISPIERTSTQIPIIQKQLKQTLYGDEIDRSRDDKSSFSIRKKTELDKNNSTNNFSHRVLQ